MNAQIEEILEKPLAFRVGILIGSLAIIGLVFWFVFFAPVEEQYASVVGDVDKLQREVAEKIIIAQNLNSYREEVRRLDVELKRALEELPDKREIHLLLSKVSDKARDAGLDIQLFRPKGEQKKDFYAEVPVEIEVNGTYHQVGAFFDEVGHLERLVNLDQFGMTDPKRVEGTTVLKIAVVATAFRFLDESERPKEMDKGKKGKRRKRRASNEGDI